ncbi:hypothetical protein 2 [Beihai picorna-like virus 20]|uniref:hypothetical protein 2 n=1 Tax=Beihai picorna-like virus 20 TaxID=1922563 RepID=UPI000909739D|nr:hypothetical protein 2 [Beihai picorna-like virus 20]APG76788.1 hypothetical protein 2 [Beihai picorna-like virus 20]
MYSIQSQEDMTRCNEDTNDVDLAAFFRRPVRIREFEWGTGVALSQAFDPWLRFFSDKRVVNRISNFNLLRAKLHLKVVINGNGFQYGRAILAYNALDSFDKFSPSLLIDDDLVQLSQLPHIYLNPTTSQGGDLTLPFFYHLNSYAQSSGVFTDIGKCYLRSINTLKHANGASDKVTISIFAWAEDITLAVPTSQNSTILTAQMGEIDEANAKGTISGPATAVADAAATLSSVPIIGPYAKATEMPARMVAKIAKALGYCRPPETKNPEPYRNTAISSLAVTNVPDNTQKLTVDDKQELTIDPGISGVAEGDVLTIKDIARRESFLTKFSWNVGTAPDTLLWNARVDPVIWAQSASTFHFPACAMASIPFKYWTGTMKFRFQVVTSNYHKGRLRIAYDPNFFASDTEFNVNYMHIVDIAEKTDFTVSVTNGQQVTLLDHHLPGIDSVTQMYSTTRYTAKEEGNGVIQVSVLNELTVPNSITNNDIEINVFVSMGDDFEVFVPDDHFQQFTVANPVLEAQSGEIGVDKIELDSDPVKENADPLNGSEGVSDKTNLVFTGESIKSFRTMLKRYNMHFGLSPLDQFHNEITLRMNSYPYYRGRVTGAVNNTSPNGKYNYCHTVMLHWITLAFSGWRGGIRWKALPRGGWEHLTSTVERAGIIQSSQHDLDVTAPSAPATQSQAAESAVNTGVIGTTLGAPLPGTKGMAYTVRAVNPCLEFEIPFYSPARFVPGRVEDWTSNTETRYNEVFDFKAWGSSLEGEETFIDFYVSAAEDFQVYFFKGLPRLYHEPLLPPPL